MLSEEFCSPFSPSCSSFHLVWPFDFSSTSGKPASCSASRSRRIVRVVTPDWLAKAGIAAPWRLDPHPDHQAVGRAAARVAHELRLPLLEYPVWATYWARPGDLDRQRQTLLVVGTDDAAEAAYAEALTAFRTQLEPLDHTVTAVVPAETLAHHDTQLVVLDPQVAR